MANEPKTLTTKDGRRVQISPFDVKASRSIPGGVEVETHAGETLQFPLSLYVFQQLMVIDLGPGNKVTVAEPIRGR